LPYELDLRERIHPKDVGKTDNHFQSIYYQVFTEKHGFIPNLSIIDLLFNMGNESRIVLRDFGNRKPMIKRYFNYSCFCFVYC
jgi:hypothetical protein